MEYSLFIQFSTEINTKWESVVVVGEKVDLDLEKAALLYQFQLKLRKEVVSCQKKRFLMHWKSKLDKVNDKTIEY